MARVQENSSGDHAIDNNEQRRPFQLTSALQCAVDVRAGAKPRNVQALCDVSNHEYVHAGTTAWFQDPATSGSVVDGFIELGHVLTTRIGSNAWSSAQGKPAPEHDLIVATTLG
ncbi:hypothetical protein SCP_0800170 [Sparassis crispa]|uniref:Uncharacterized protein n=1 Tax=Sparassis crispa TaxID=139825 RepID=A0A401GTI4_9APHY|nr:hypothetical protein SCP_0800170 [Sparassis crispa]GBE85500.1 hypothetical protein SCP_0800170 [Sparassis crispa]